MPGICSQEVISYIVIKNHLGARVAIIDDFYSLNYTHIKNGQKTFEFTMSGDSAPTLEVDYQVEVWRSNAGAGIAWYQEFEGFYRDHKWSVDNDGKLIFTCSGVGYLDLINRRIVDYPAKSAFAFKSGIGETVMKEYVYENAGAGAVVGAGRLHNGVTTGLTVAPDNAFGGNWEGDVAGKALLTVIKDIYDKSGVSYDVKGAGLAAFQFWTYYPYIGTDRRYYGINPVNGLNGAGFVPMLFSLDHGNMAQPVLTRTRSKEKNAVIVMGKGVEDEAVTEEVLDADAIDDSPWNRCEISISGKSSADTTDALVDVGESGIEKHRADDAFDFKIIQTAGMLYGRDYVHGDAVSAMFRGVLYHLEITKVSVSVMGGRNQTETITVVLEKDNA